MSQPSSPRRHHLRSALVLLAVSGAVLASTAMMGGANASGGPSATPSAQAGGRTTPRAELLRRGATLHYAIPTPNCGPATAGHRTCLSRRLIKVAKDRPGAVAYAVPAYATGPAG